MIQRAFVSRNIDLFVRAYLVYVRPLVEYNSVVWAPYTPYRILKLLKKYRDNSQKKIFLDYVNSPARRGYDVYIYPVWNWGVCILIWCGVVKYFLASRRHQLRIFSCPYVCFNQRLPVQITVKPLILATLNFGVWVNLIILDPVILAFLLPITLKGYCIQIFAARYFANLPWIAKFAK